MPPYAFEFVYGIPMAVGTSMARPEKSYFLPFQRFAHRIPRFYTLRSILSSLFFVHSCTSSSSFLPSSSVLCCLGLLRSLSALCCSSSSSSTSSPGSTFSSFSLSEALFHLLPRSFYLLLFSRVDDFTYALVFPWIFSAVSSASPSSYSASSFSFLARSWLYCALMFLRPSSSYSPFLLLHFFYLFLILPRILCLLASINKRPATFQ